MANVILPDHKRDIFIAYDRKKDEGLIPFDKKGWFIWGGIWIFLVGKKKNRKAPEDDGLVLFMVFTCQT